MSFNIRLISTLAIFLMVIVLDGSAQNYEVINLERLLNSETTTQKSSVQKASVNKSSLTPKMDIAQIRSLIYEVNPTIYIENGEIKFYGEGNPTVGDLNINEWETLKTDNPYFNSVQLLKIKYDGNIANRGFDLSQLKAFNNLEYIYIQCTSKCSMVALEDLFENVDGISIVYLITITE